MFIETIQSIRSEFQKSASSITSLKEYEEVHVAFLGKKGRLADLMGMMRTLSNEEKPLAGKEINVLKEEITSFLEGLKSKLEHEAILKQLEVDKIDVTEPAKMPNQGARHVALQLLDRVIDIFKEMGFSVQYGPDVDSEYYNFTALNMGPDHPARDMQDTFYVDPTTVLRTHATNTQVRIMEKYKPPIRAITPGKCYRNEDISARSHVQFHQVDGLYIDKNVTFLDLLATLNAFLEKLFGKPVKTRFRPSYFPFVEPGIEVDVECLNCGSQGCSTCKHSGWLEILGAGMVHPEVLKAGGIDPQEYSGFAWGMGTGRLTLLAHKIPDIRLLMENDLRFLEQFH